MKDHQEAVHAAQEGTVVRHGDDRALETLQCPLERLRRIDVEVVGRLVEQQQVVAVELEAEDLQARLLAPAQHVVGRRAASARP